MLVSKHTFSCFEWKHFLEEVPLPLWLFRHLLLSWPLFITSSLQPCRLYDGPGAMENAWNTFMEDLEEILDTDWNITGMNAARVISIFKLIVNDRENYKPSYLLSVSKARRERLLLSLRRSQEKWTRKQWDQRKNGQWNEEWEFRKINFQLSSTDQAI